MALILIQISASIQSNNFSKEKASAKYRARFFFSGNLINWTLPYLRITGAFDIGLLQSDF